MKVLFLVSAHGWPERITPFSFIDEEIRALVAEGVEAFIISPHVARNDERDGIHMIAVPPGTLRDRIRTLPFFVASAPHLPPGAWGDLRHTFHAVRLERHAASVIRRFGIDLMHTHFGGYGLAGMLARASTGIPLVATFRGMDLLLDPSIEYGARQEPFYDRTVQALLRKADVTTYVSDFMQETGVGLGARPETARTIRKGVDLDRFSAVSERAALRAELRAELDFEGPMILTVAGLIPRKGIDVLIEAVARMGAEPRPTLVICGDGRSRDALAALAEERGVGERVRFRGWVARHEIPRYFAACDVFVLPSRLEAAGNVLLEAMASGRPVVTTDSGGPPEYVQDGRTGFVVPPGDANALADRLDRLLADASLRESMGREGRQVVERAHDYGGMIDGFLEVYHRAVERAGPTRTGAIRASP